MKKLTARNYLGYASGDLANNLAFSLQALFLLIYSTNVVGLNPAAIATALTWRCRMRASLGLWTTVTTRAE